MNVFVARWCEYLPEDVVGSKSYDEEQYSTDEVLGVYSTAELAWEATEAYKRGRLLDDGDPDSNWEEHADIVAVPDGREGEIDGWGRPPPGV